MQRDLHLEHLITACRDSYLVDLEMAETYGDYSLHRDSIKEFVDSLPKDERAQVVDEQGVPTYMANARMEAALLFKGFSNEMLVKQAYLSHSPESRKLLCMLRFFGQLIFDLGFTKDGYDIRDIISQAFIEIIAKLDGGLTLKEMRKNIDGGDLGVKDPNCQAVHALKKCIIKYSKDLDELDEFVSGFTGALLYANAKDEGEPKGKIKLHETYSEEDVAKRQYPFVDLSAIHIPKMSSYMRNFWYKHGECFFDVHKRQNFIEELRQYRTTLENA